MRCFKAADRADLEALLEKYVIGKISEYELILLMINMKSKKATSEGLLSSFSERMRDKYLVEKYKEYIKALKRPYGNIGESLEFRLSKYAGYEGKVDELVFNANGEIIRIITWENDEQTQGVLRDAAGNIQKYLKVAWTENGVSLKEYEKFRR